MMYEGRTQERQSAVNDMSGMRGGIALIRRLVRAVASGIRSVLDRVKNTAAADYRLKLIFFLYCAISG